MKRLVSIVVIVGGLIAGLAAAQTVPDDPWFPPPPDPNPSAFTPWPEAFESNLGRLYPSVRRVVGSLAEDPDGVVLLDALLALAQSPARGPSIDREPIEGTCAYLGGTGGSLVGDGGSGTLFADGGSGSLVPDGGTGSLFGDGGAVLQPFMPAYFEAMDIEHAWSLLFVSEAGRANGLAPAVSLHDEIAIIDRFELDAFEKGDAGPFGDFKEASLTAAWLAALTPRAVPPAKPELVVVPHGHLVLHHTLQMLIGHYGGVRNLSVHRRSVPDRAEITLTWSSGRTTRVTVFPMDFRTLDGLGPALAFLARPEEASHRIVMSWTLSNCVLLERYGAASSADDGEPGALDPTASQATTSYAEFVYALLGDGLRQGGQPLLEALCQAMRSGEEALRDIPCDDAFALSALLADLDRRASEDVGDEAYALTSGALWLRGFAAAGNQRLPFPLPPASWPGVYGVAACSPARTANAWFSNRGDVVAAEHLIAPGAWYFEDPFGAHATDLGYWGTSFAAPYAALRFVPPDAQGSTGPFALGTCDVSIIQGRYRR